MSRQADEKDTEGENKGVQGVIFFKTGIEILTATVPVLTGANATNLLQPCVGGPCVSIVGCNQSGHSL